MMDLVRVTFRTCPHLRSYVFSGLPRRIGHPVSDGRKAAGSGKALVSMKLRIASGIPFAGSAAGKISSRKTLLAGLLSASMLAGCSQGPAETRGGVWRNDNTKEYFGQKRYGKASPRVVRNGRRVPKGGGRAIIGRPYKVAGKRYYPRQYQPGQTQFGRASWYGDAFHGRKTANGEIYDMSSISAAHPTMPLPSYARVTNRKNGRSIIVRVNDRGPFHGGRVIDLSKRVADLLDFRRHGTANVKVEYLRPASVAGSDDRMLVASLRTDGSPAQMDGGGVPGRTMIAGLFGSKKEAPVSATRRAPDRPVITTTARPLPAVPQQALAETGRPAASTVTQTSAETTTVVSASPAPERMPVPLARPFDLATIPGASTPIAAYAGRRRNEPPVSVTRVSFFAPMTLGAPVAARLRKRGPFEGIDVRRLRLLRRGN